MKNQILSVIDRLNEAHVELAKTDLKHREYNKISRKIGEVKNLLYNEVAKGKIRRSLASK